MAFWFFFFLIQGEKQEDGGGGGGVLFVRSSNVPSVSGEERTENGL